MLRAKVRLKNLGSIRAVTEAEEALRLCAAALVRRVQQVSSELFGRDYRAIGVGNRHVTGSVSGGASFRLREAAGERRVGVAPASEIRNRWRGEGVESSPMPASWNQIAGWLRQIDTLRQAA